MKLPNRLNAPFASLLLVAGITLGLVQPANAAFPGSNGRIAFTRYQGGDWEIFAINPDGTGLANLTNNNRDDYWPDWSADGTKIAFIGDGGDLYTMNADGSGQTKLLDYTCNRCRAPSWSPDGSRIAFNYDHDGNSDIYLIDADGTDLTRLTRNAGVDVQPAWSPDGTQITFKSRRHRKGAGDIYVMNVDRTGLTRLTTALRDDLAPDWSPDGTKIAFASRRVRGNLEIYVMNSDGTDQTMLTNTPRSYEGYPAWSPDGMQIAFDNVRRAENICVMDADGSDRTNLTKNGLSFGPSWQPL
jgi:Tol biopolymer transport system component